MPQLCPLVLCLAFLALVSSLDCTVATTAKAGSPSPSSHSTVRVRRHEESPLGSRIQERVGDGHWKLAAVDPVVDCPLKLFATQFAAYLQPSGWSHASNWTESTFHALNLSAICNVSISDVQPPPEPRISTLPLSVTELGPCGWTRFVDGAIGSDSNDGSEGSPYMSVQYALAQSRLTGSGDPTQKCITVRRGVYYLGADQTNLGRPFESQRGVLSLTSLDSNIAITAYPGEEVAVLGRRRPQLTVAGVSEDWSGHHPAGQAAAIYRGRLAAPQ